MSLFGSLMGDFDDDIFGNHMNAMNMQMRSMNRLMNSFMPDPFNMLTNFDGGFQQNALMERQNPHHMGGLFGFPAMPNMNRLLSADIGNNGAAFCSSSVITMSSGPDGRPQIYQATSSTKTGPGGIRETRRTVQDSVNGVKKMAIGHHIGERAHIIEKEQDLRSGQLEEHQEFINLDEDEAEDFDREFITKAHGATGRGGARAICAAPTRPQQALTIEEIDDDEDDVIETIPHVQEPPSSTSTQNRRQLPNIPTTGQQPPLSHASHHNSSSPKLTTTTSSSSATKISSSSSTSRNNLSAGLSSPTMPLSTSTTTTTPYTTTNSGINSSNQYLSATPRRSSYRGNHHITGASPRRPLRTPPSSPLATTSTLHSHSTTTTPSVHPHPYNTSAARRSHHHHQHRPKQHGTTKQHTASSANNNNQTAAAAATSSQYKEEDNNSK